MQNVFVYHILHRYSVLHSFLTIRFTHITGNSITSLWVIGMPKAPTSAGYVLSLVWPALPCPHTFGCSMHVFSVSRWFLFPGAYPDDKICQSEHSEAAKPTVLHSTTLHQTKTYVKPLVPPEESQTWIIPMSVALLAVILWREWHKGSSSWRAGMSEDLLWQKRCSGHQPGFGVLPQTEHPLLTAPHCSPVLLAQRKLLILALQGKDLQKNTSLPLIVLDHTQQNLGTPNSLWWHLRLIWSAGYIMLNLVNTFNEERKPWIQK